MAVGKQGVLWKERKIESIPPKSSDLKNKYNYHYYYARLRWVQKSVPILPSFLIIVYSVSFENQLSKETEIIVAQHFAHMRIT